jgi:hypothetical protein
MPQEIVDLLNKEINAALADSTIETEHWRKVVEMSGQKKERGARGRGLPGVARLAISRLAFCIFFGTLHFNG